MKEQAAICYEYGSNLYINMTNQCSNNCNFCLRNNSDGSIYAENLWYSGQEPSKEEILQALKSKDIGSYESLVFCGYGEPACRWDDMIWLCDMLRDMGSFFIRLNTNGQSDLITGRTDTALELQGRVDSLSVSLNASTAEKYQQVCASAYGLEALPAILRFTTQAATVLPYVRMTVVSTMEQEEIDACRKLCAQTGADFVIREYIEK